MSDTPVAIILALCSSGAIGAAITGVVSHRKGVRDADIARDQTAITGFQELTESLRAEVLRLRDDRAVDEKRVEDAEGQVKQARSLYWAAVAYVRTLLAWIDRQLPDQHPPPAPPDLAGDIHDHRKDPS